MGCPIRKIGCAINVHDTSVVAHIIALIETVFSAKYILLIVIFFISGLVILYNSKTL
jgi:hypothetical protein